MEPDLPNWQHDIAGRLCIIDQTTLVIRDFGYDGRGPGMTFQCLLFFIIRSYIDRVAINDIIIQY